MKIHVQIFMWTCVLIYLEECIGVEFRVRGLLVLEKISSTFSKVVEHFIFPPISLIILIGLYQLRVF